jgi:CheY-like chemotaxis protein
MRVLVADADLARARSFTEALLARGHRVEHAAHGATALEMALEALPDAVIAPIDLPVIDGGRLAEILRGNPRTRRASFVFLVKDELDAPLAMDARDSIATAPWRVADVLATVDDIVERLARFGAERAPADIEGKLEQIALADLLQIFELNRRTGVLRVWKHGDTGAATLVLRVGQVLDAQVPLLDGTSVVGEKALFRALTWRAGRFEFVPGPVAEEGRIRRGTRALLLEGARQLHEWETLVTELGSRELRLAVRVPREQIPPTVHPLTREVIEAVEAYRELGAILDHTSFPDAQVMRVLSDLLGRGALAPEEPSGERGRAAASFSPAQHRRLRDWAAAQRPRPGSVLKVLVLAGDAPVMRAVAAALRECPDFQPDLRLLREPERAGRAGLLGHFPLGRSWSMRLLGMLADADQAPLLPVMAHGMLGAIVVVRSSSGPRIGPLLEEHMAALGSARVQTLRIAGEGPAGPTDPAERADAGHLLPASPGEARVRVLREVLAGLVP